MKIITKKVPKYTECRETLIKTYKTVELCGKCNKTIAHKYWSYCAYCGEKIERV